MISFMTRANHCVIVWDYSSRSLPYHFRPYHIITIVTVPINRDKWSSTCIGTQLVTYNGTNLQPLKTKKIFLNRWFYNSLLCQYVVFFIIILLWSWTFAYYLIITWNTINENVLYNMDISHHIILCKYLTDTVNILENTVKYYTIIVKKTFINTG